LQQFLSNEIVLYLDIVQKVKLKPLNIGDSYGIPPERKVLFRRQTFTPSYHKVFIEVSKYKQ